MNTKKINIAIDGPAGAGKSTIAKGAAKELGFIYVDTGALYRAIAYYVIKHNGNPKIENDVIPMLKNISVELKFAENQQGVLVNNEDISDKIRTPEISAGSSDVSAIPKVREFLFELQRKIAKENNVIMDGRDIGTVVLPNADLKIFLTASPEERAKRRFQEMKNIEKQQTYDQVLEAIKIRDYNDSHREIAPLKQADDAVLFDTTGISLELSILMVINMIQDKLN